MATYRFVTTCQLTASPGAVFDAVLRPGTWLQRWEHTRRVELLAAGDEDGVGARFRAGVRARLPYTLCWEMETVRAVRPQVIEWRARGDLDGTGVWELAPADAGTDARATWTVATTRPWMNVAAVVARRVLVHNHNVVMRSGVEALARALDAEVRRYRAREERR